MNPEGKARVVCTACETLKCRMLQDDVDVRHIRSFDGLRVADWPETVLGCPVLRKEFDEGYMLWVLGWTDLIKVLEEETNV